MQKLGFCDYITVAEKDVFKVTAKELRPLKLDYISTSAATNPTFDMKIIYLAVQAGIPNVLMPETSLKYLKSLGILTSRMRGIVGCSSFAQARVQPADSSESRGDIRNIWRLDLSSAELVTKIKGAE